MRAEALLLVGVTVVACGGATADPALDAWLRLAGAQFVPGALVARPEGPKVVTLNVSRNQARRGDTALHISGAMEPSANAVALWMAGDRGFWLLPAGVPDVTMEGVLPFAATAAVGLDAPLGSRTISVAALSRQGVAGPVAQAALVVLERSEVASGTLVFTLRWDTDVDLDLHVVDPSGVEVWARNPNSWHPTPGADPAAWRTGGTLDVDSNAQCVIDGRRVENVAWTVAPLAGRYVARVDAFSLCGKAAARWWLEARREGALLASAEGVATVASTRPPHDLGAGVVAMELDVP